jgi:hypothetical protein
MNSPLEEAFKAKLENTFQESAQEEEEFDLFAEETEEDRANHARDVEQRRRQVAEAAQARQEAYEKSREAFERGEIEPVKVDAEPLKRAVNTAARADEAPLVALADAMGLVLMGSNRTVLEKVSLGDGSWLGAIQTGYSISQGHYATTANKRFGTAAALLCLAKAGNHPSDEKITKLANLLNEVLDENITAQKAAERMAQQ